MKRTFAVIFAALLTALSLGKTAVSAETLLRPDDTYKTVYPLLNAMVPYHGALLDEGQTTQTYDFADLAASGIGVRGKNYYLTYDVSFNREYETDENGLLKSISFEKEVFSRLGPISGNGVTIVGLEGVGKSVAYLEALGVKKNTEIANAIQEDETPEQYLRRCDLITSEDYIASDNGTGEVSRRKAAQLLYAFLTGSAEDKIVPVVKTDTMFTDLAGTESDFGYMLTMEKLGIVKGSGDAKYRPEDNLTNRDSLVMLLRLLGYEDRAEEAGGYPSGYYAVAKELGILSEGDSTEGEKEPVSFTRFSSMLVKALDVPRMELSAYDMQSGKATRVAGETYRTILTGNFGKEAQPTA